MTEIFPFPFYYSFKNLTGILNHLWTLKNVSLDLCEK